MSKIIISAVVEGISTRSDNTFKIVIGTQEIDKNHVADLFSLVNQFCKVLITDNNISPLDDKLIDELKIKDGKKVKTQSQKMRAILFRLWEQSGLQITFDDFYTSKTQAIIDHYKNELDK